MSTGARVTSVEALRDFQIVLAKCCEAMRDALISNDMVLRRTLDWVQYDQSRHWKKQINVRQEELAQAKGELERRQMSKMSGYELDTTEQVEAVRVAKYRLEVAYEKSENCARWSRALPRDLDEYNGPARQLAALVEGDPPHMVNLLARIIESLEAYLATNAPRIETPEVKSE